MFRFRSVITQPASTVTANAMSLSFGRRLPFSPQIRAPFRHTHTSPNHPPGLKTFRTILYSSVAVASTTLFAVYYFDSRAAIHRYVITPLLRATAEPESSHKFALRVLKSGWAPRDLTPDDETLKVELWGEQISNPIGLAAGFDKDGEAIDGLFNLGFGWVEIGSVTPKPQPGNPQPRVFRLLEDEAVINRYGFPSKGHVSLLSRLRAREDSSTPTHRILSLNLGKNKTSPPDSIEDFLHGIRTFGSLVDTLVINVSSPNTPGLRSLQSRSMLTELLGAVVQERDALPTSQRKSKPKLLVKIAPDLSEPELEDVAEVVKESGIDGVIISNTTIERPPTLESPYKTEQGGLSGPPLKPLSLRALRTLRSLLPASIPIIGAGGIASGKDALEYAKAGASAVQIYTSFGYGGVGTPRRIKDELTEVLRKEGKTWQEVVKDSVDKLAPKGSKERIEKVDREDEMISMGEELMEILKESAVTAAAIDGSAAVEEATPPPLLP